MDFSIIKSLCNFFFLVKVKNVSFNMPCADVHQLYFQEALPLSLAEQVLKFLPFYMKLLSVMWDAAHNHTCIQ